MNSVVMITILERFLSYTTYNANNSAIEQMKNYWQKCLMETYQLPEEFGDEKNSSWTYHGRFAAHGLIKICEIWGKMDEKYEIHVETFKI